MRIQPREVMLALATVAVVLFGGSYLLGRPKWEELKGVRRLQSEAMQQIAQDMKMVEQRERWETELAELSKRLPMHPHDKQMDVYWMSVMDDLASKHGVRITRRQAGEEKRNGDLYELPIDCKEWEADLSSIIHFLFDLQEEGDMLDCQQIYMKPRENGQLRGRFTLNCAYTREPASGAAKTAPEKSQTTETRP